jgi:hypothetical protein
MNSIKEREINDGLRLMDLSIARAADSVDVPVSTVISSASDFTAAAAPTTVIASASPQKESQVKKEVSFIKKRFRQVLSLNFLSKATCICAGKIEEIWTVYS